jgi:hypothetical protein
MIRLAGREQENARSNSMFTNGTGTFQATFNTTGNQTITATGRQATTDFVGGRLSGFGKDNVLQGTASRISGADFTPETSPVVSIVEEPSGYVKVFITLLIVEKWGVKIVAIFESFAYRIAAN